jgi:uncharacterized protein (DUF885 family)
LPEAHHNSFGAESPAARNLMRILSLNISLLFVGTVASMAGSTPPLDARLAAAADSFVAFNRGFATGPTWGDLSDSVRQRGFARLDSVGVALARIDRASLSTAEDRLVYDNLSEIVDARRGARVCHAYLWSGTSQFAGWHVAASNVARVIAVTTPEQRESALARFRALPRAIEAERALLERGADSGYTASRDVVNAVIKQYDDLLPDDPTTSPLYEPARRDSSRAFQTAWLTVVRDSIYPAARRFRAYLDRDYRPRARESGALATLPNGVACYTANLRAQTSVKVNTDSVMRDARAEYDRLASRLAPLTRKLTGLSDLGTAVIALRTDPRFTFPSRDSILSTYRATAVLAASRVGRVVAGFEPESLAVVPYPAFQENAGLPPQYIAAAPDGSRPAQFMVNLSRTERMSAPNAVSHEGYPGHHLQRIAESRAPVVHPAMRQLGVGAFSEGWGIYSEDLADEMGLYQSALDRAGWLIHMMDVAMGEYLDIAYHTKGWSRQTLIDTMMVLGGRPATMAAAYADRHAATPGQIATYYIGYRAIRSERTRAERELGASFRLPDFNREIIRDGTVTLASMHSKIDAWIRETKARP